MSDETQPAPEAPEAPDAPPSALSKPTIVAKKIQARMKATGQRVSKERGAHTRSKKNPGKRAKKGGS